MAIRENERPPATPHNTAEDGPLANFTTAAFGGGIEDQEAQGQRELLASETLPTKILWCSQADMEALGFRFGDEVAGDPAFRQVSLPDGWSRKGSEHAMWSYIVDERGIERVAVFYKAAFYDRRAHMGIQNVGRKVATEWICGDGAPALHPRMIRAELEDARADAIRFMEDAERNPDIYGDRLPRARSLVAAVDAALTPDQRPEATQ